MAFLQVTLQQSLTTNQPEYFVGGSYIVPYPVAVIGLEELCTQNVAEENIALGMIWTYVLTA